MWGDRKGKATRGWKKGEQGHREEGTWFQPCHSPSPLAEQVGTSWALPPSNPFLLEKAALQKGTSLSPAPSLEGGVLWGLSCGSARGWEDLGELGAESPEADPDGQRKLLC